VLDEPLFPRAEKGGRREKLSCNYGKEGGGGIIRTQSSQAAIEKRESWSCLFIMQEEKKRKKKNSTVLPFDPAKRRGRGGKSLFNYSFAGREKKGDGKKRLKRPPPLLRREKRSVLILFLSWGEKKKGEKRKLKLILRAHSLFFLRRGRGDCTGRAATIPTCKFKRRGRGKKKKKKKRKSDSCVASLLMPLSAERREGR